MAKMKRYNVISLRITDQEKESLERLMQTTSRSASAVMREALRIITGHSDSMQALGGLTSACKGESRP